MKIRLPERLDALPLLEACTRFFLVERGEAEGWLGDGRVFVNGVSVRGGKVRGGDLVEVGAALETVEIPVVWEEGEVVVVHKPAGIAAEGARGSVIERLGDGYRTVHRLDRAVSGLLLLARSRGAAGVLAGDFKERQIKKIYLARVEGEAGEDVFEIDAPLRWLGAKRRAVVDAEGEPALSRVRPLGDGWVLVELVTGRSHQIRAHLADRGLPIRGDSLYGEGRGRPGAIALHALALGFRRPDGGAVVRLVEMPSAGWRERWGAPPDEMDLRAQAFDLVAF